MFRQLTQAMSGAATLSARVMAKAIAAPADTALWAREITSRRPPQPGISNVMGSIAMDPATHLAEYLKIYWHVHDREYLNHFSDYYDWYLYPVDLPGQLYLWAVEHLFVKNELFNGELEVAGQTVSLRSITCPVFLLGGEEDDTTPWQQVRNMRYAVGSSLVRWSAGTWHRAGTSTCSSAASRRLSTGRRSWLRSASSHDQGVKK